MDRTVATGTAFIGQYPPEVQKLYEPLTECPDNLLLFFHHVPFTFVLHSGKTVIQHIYDSHYDGAEQAHGFIAEWKALEGHIDPERHRDILARFEFQAGEAVKWRDAICAWIYRLSAIPDQKGRSGLSQRECPNQISTCSANLKKSGLFPVITCGILPVPLTFTVPEASR